MMFSGFRVLQRGACKLRDLVPGRTSALPWRGQKALPYSILSPPNPESLNTQIKFGREGAAKTWSV